LWLDEGVAQVIERIVVARDGFTIDNIQVEQHRMYWSPRKLQDFWSGCSFGQPDAGQRLSYQLAEVLVRNLLQDHRPRFVDFLAHARQADCGEDAAREYLGMSLGNCAATFLGPGDWKPRVTDAGSRKPARI
jgi:hypothetical protein